MSETDVIELLINQKQSALDVWKNLLTVALAILAYYGAMRNKVSKEITIAIIALYSFFALSNARALYVNFATKRKI